MSKSMSRGVYGHEQDDSDFAWLISNYKNSCKKSILIDIPGSPIVLIAIPETEQSDPDHDHSSEQKQTPSNQDRS
jgi:hypothetical protein